MTYCTNIIFYCKFTTDACSEREKNMSDRRPSSGFSSSFDEFGEFDSHEAWGVQRQNLKSGVFLHYFSTVELRVTSDTSNMEFD